MKLGLVSHAGVLRGACGEGRNTSSPKNAWLGGQLKFGRAGFREEGNTGVPGQKPLGAGEKTNMEINSPMASTPGLEPWSNWWEASAFFSPPRYPSVHFSYQ